MCASPSSEEVSSLSIEVLQDVTRRVKEVCDILNRETNRVCKEGEAHDGPAKKPEQNPFPKILRLNVGGYIFLTSLETLRNDASSGSMLQAMFSGRFHKKPSEDGSYFIDRDGTYFRYILSYLRTGQLIVPKDEIIRKELLAEAEFYQVEGIVKALTARPFQDSSILSSEQCRTLMNWLKETGAIEDIAMARDNLLYRASRDGWTASNFHSCCDNKGPTVTVIQNGNYIFGGYTEHEWKDAGDWTKAPGSFLFSLVNPSGLPPTKMPLKPGEEKYAIYCRSDYGPIFGRGHDLAIVNEPNSKDCWTSLNNSYQCPFDQTGATFLTGNEYFTISEMEVFVTIEK